MRKKPVLKYIVSALVVIVVAFSVIVALQPSDFRVTRTATIAAPPEAVFVQVNNLHRWEAWSPWAKLDPAAKNTYEGPAAGVGAAFAWSGNRQVGEGRMTITDSRPNEAVRMNLEFIKPFKATNITEFTFKPEGSQTVVTWTMSGKNNFISKAIGLFMDCDKMVGGQFEKGLAQMKSIAEAAT
jgi:uncharacterized protein YndB with AHSA1/START domain